MHARFKLRRYQVLATRSQILAAAAQRMVEELHHLAETQQSAELAALTEAYRAATEDVKQGVQTGANLPPLLFKLEALGRDVANTLSALQQALIHQTAQTSPDTAIRNDDPGDPASIVACTS